MEKSLAVFEGKEIRKVWHQEEWWFVVEDIISVLTDSKDSKQYINKMRQRDDQLSQGWVQLVHTLAVPTLGGSQQMNCSNTEGIFRIIQSIPSSKTEPLKLWLAKVGYERVQEIQDPELAQKRMKELYKAKGYSEDWIEKRVRGIAIRDELTDEWKKRDVGTEREYAILENARWLRTKCGVNNNSSHFLFKKDSVFLNEKSQIFLFRKLANRYESRKDPDEVRR
ncbi:TPA: Bro-N domain-containing protein [Candidatus Woesearchaeota archaeon]|nr:Bro-N domain-containing protein [Candidatus Woesearchaeota archaeon]